MTGNPPNGPFSIRLDVRVYELDPQLHLTGAAYVQYADHSRFACLQAAGVSVEDLIGSGLGPVNLDTRIRYHREIRGGDQVEVSCGWEWAEGKTYRVHHVLRHLDGTVAAEIDHVSGLLDLTARRLVPDPAREWRTRASRPDLLGFHAEDLRDTP
ncbi:acyl-CoA thioesterase [Streptosporangium minutum]|uniref:Thioesterase n=1 Tax=Streptosporangium minutum TaxID=569862 RepID=A0A243RD57_9ACTN|nr:acyl-CoA thioesterase [Streptosporangium minutum]OUC92594.1 thioesterase [Streptosporangium minutum]